VNTEKNDTQPIVPQCTFIHLILRLHPRTHLPPCASTAHSLQPSLHSDRKISNNALALLFEKTNASTGNNPTSATMRNTRKTCAICAPTTRNFAQHSTSSFEDLLDLLPGVFRLHTSVPARAYTRVGIFRACERIWYPYHVRSDCIRHTRGW